LFQLTAAVRGESTGRSFPLTGRDGTVGGKSSCRCVRARRAGNTGQGAVAGA
jgi:hypothetical protein